MRGEARGEPRRVLVIGPGGSGKTTVARAVAERTGLPLIHLDRHYWRPGWEPTPEEEWRATVAELVKGPGWVMDGNYGGTLDLRLPVADTVVFLDVPRTRCLWRIVKRWVRHRGSSRPSLAEGCEERLTWEFVRWVWSYPERRRPGVLARLERLDPGTRVHVLRSDGGVRRFLAGLEG